MSGPVSTGVRHRWLRRLGIAAVVFLSILAATGLYTYLKWNTTPQAWEQAWKRINTMPHDQKQSVTEDLRNRLLEEWSATEPSAGLRNPDESDASATSLIGQRRQFAIPFDDLNIWLDIEGMPLLESIGVKLPGSVQHVMLDGNNDGELIFAFQDGAGQSGRVYTLRFQLHVADDGTLTSKLVDARAGTLSIPVDSAIGLLRGAQGDENETFLAMLTGKPVPPIDIPIDPADDGLRDGRIVGLQINGSEIIVTRQTVRRAEHD